MSEDQKYGQLDDLYRRKLSNPGWTPKKDHFAAIMEKSNLPSKKGGGKGWYWAGGTSVLLLLGLLLLFTTSSPKKNLTVPSAPAIKEEHPSAQEFMETKTPNSEIPVAPSIPVAKPKAETLREPKKQTEAQEDLKGEIDSLKALLQKKEPHLLPDLNEDAAPKETTSTLPEPEKTTVEDIVKEPKEEEKPTSSWENYRQENTEDEEGVPLFER